jgi:NET1-associated nuclear protein 1 (U3 small nucleolar RNA-associated protein 17)
MSSKTGSAVLVGGPLLGEKSLYTTSTTENENVKSPEQLKWWNTFEPIIAASRDEEFIFMPNASFVTVLAYKTGRRVATLCPQLKDEQVIIESVCVATVPNNNNEQTNTIRDALVKLGTTASNEQQERDHKVLLMGCKDGTIREFDLSVLFQQQKGASVLKCGDYEVPGPCHRPRRVFSITDKEHQPIKHLTTPNHVLLTNKSVLLYALVEKSPPKEKETSKVTKFTVQELVRVMLPVFHDTTPNDKIISLKNDDKDSNHVVIHRELKCVLEKDKQGKFRHDVPFSLSSLSGTKRHSTQKHAADFDVFVVVARPNKIQIYLDQVTSGEIKQETMCSVSFPMKRFDRLSSISIAPNGNDVTCGYMDGEISIMIDMIPQALQYLLCIKEGKKRPRHPAKTVLNRRVHWHSQPVTSLAYQQVNSSGSGGRAAAVDPMLYSGGFESVLVTWQLARGTLRPAHVLPRLAKGGILHISCTKGAILVYCEDNSLQLIAAHNSNRLWKVQGLASSTGDSLGNSNARVEPTIRTDSLSGSSNTLILSGLPGAPGYLHWYDTREQQVTAQLEVAPFNRVSRTEHDDIPLPVPSVTHVAFSESGRDLVTVDTMPTENSGIGATERLSDGKPIGVVSTIRFWSWNPMDNKKNPKSGPYSLTAAMTYPHGEENHVTAIAVSNDGQYACTVSNGDNAFRLWHKVLSENDDAPDTDGKSRRTPVWLCQFKVTNPSGYSNFRTGSNAVDFSSDGSILAICYGNMITLWDHKEATLLTALQHIDNDRAPIESLSFVKTALLNDLILTRSRTGVALQSPYGKGKGSWSWALPGNYKDAFVTHAELIPSHDLVALCIAHHKKMKTQVFLLNAATGALQGDEKNSIFWELPGSIRSIGAKGKAVKHFNWIDISTLRDGKPVNKASPVQLFATMSNGEMVMLSSDGAVHSIESGDVFKATRDATDAPRLKTLKRGDARKRRREYPEIEEVDALPKKTTRGSLFYLSFGSDDTESTSLPSSELPALGGSFARAFVSRNLASNKE